MLFTDLNFLYLFLVTFIAYYIARSSKLQIAILIAASFVFYSFHNPYLLTLLVISIALNTFSYLRVVAAQNKQEAKRFATLGVVINLSILGTFKYFNFIHSSLFSSMDLPELLINIPLPIGISFYTFQGISLVIDAYRGDIKQDPKYKSITLFIAFFPQLVAGPIVKAKDFLPQISYKTLKNIDYDFAFRRLVEGYFLKMVVANNLSEMTFYMQNPYFKMLDSKELFILLNGYSVQIFADFAGYSSIAIGIAALFGYRLKENFNYPYIATSFKDFWQRWHISLSTFLKDYLYIPLGGNRKGTARTYLNLLITMCLGGFWHGAAWSYLVWGAFHGVVLVLERFFAGIIQRNLLPNFFKIGMVYFLVTLAWLLFKLPEFDHVLGYIKALLANQNLKEGLISKSSLYVIMYSLPVFFMHLYQFKKYKFLPHWFIYGLMLFSIICFSETGVSFIYFQF
jgi:alginate O-acetyltransferase complex protein AlgI